MPAHNYPPLDTDKLINTIKQFTASLETDTITATSIQAGKWQTMIDVYIKDCAISKTRSIKVLDGGCAVAQDLTDNEMVIIGKHVLECCTRHNLRPSKAYRYHNAPCLTYYIKPVWAHFQKDKQYE